MSLRIWALIYDTDPTLCQHAKNSHSVVKLGKGGDNHDAPKRLLVRPASSNVLDDETDDPGNISTAEPDAEGKSPSPSPSPHPSAGVSAVASPIGGKPK